MRRRLRWFWEDPFEVMEEMQRAWEESFRKVFSPVLEPWEEAFERIEARMPVDIEETEKEVIVKADLPGFNKEEVSVEVLGNKLSISAQKKEEKVEQDKNYYKKERIGKVARRTIVLPCEVDAENAKVEFENGVLTITLPKKEIEKKVKLL